MSKDNDFDGSIRGETLTTRGLKVATPITQSQIKYTRELKVQFLLLKFIGLSR